MKIKNDLYEKIQKWHRIVSLKTDEKTIIFKNDNVIEYKKFEKLIEINDIKMKYITVYTFEKNDVAKRFNRTIVQMIRSMLIWIELFQFFWNETICTVNYFKNLMSAKQNKKKSSNELWTDDKSNVNHLKKFECLIHVYISTAKRNKFDFVSF